MVVTLNNTRAVNIVYQHDEAYSAGMFVEFSADWLGVINGVNYTYNQVVRLNASRELWPAQFLALQQSPCRAIVLFLGGMCAHDCPVCATAATHRHVRSV